MPNNSDCTIDRLDIVVNTDSFSSLCAGAVSVINMVKNWNTYDIGFELFKDGITNHLVKCYLKDNPDQALLIRVYGEKTELFIDRDLEVRNMQMMCEAGLCAPLYCAFNNGLCYGFSPGEVLDTKMVRDPDISKLIAGRLAKMHSVQSNVNGVIPIANLFPVLYKYLNLIPESFPDPVKDVRYMSLIAPKDKLKEEIECLKEHLVKMESPVVFCHNDLLLKNIIYNREKEVTFIDYEYADYNYQAFDIGNHFCEFMAKIEDSFLTVSVKDWPKMPSYKKAAIIAKNWVRVNESAEQAVALIKDFNCATKNEEQKRFLLQVVEMHRKNFKQCNCQTLLEI
ncbi:Ethanolamine kinase 1 [Araneus ventricosus]|uniref:ethanolamine kinase n=1 Tax=Araneus ventricosus TaxID=182803 RepID=A0A4Y2JKW5_ARAVE|nr:Ethanolamine kinase 1 [Araneus ventricosus]